MLRVVLAAYTIGIIRGSIRIFASDGGAGSCL